MSFFKKKKKRNTLDELCIPAKAEERSMIEFRLGPKIEHQDRHNPESAPKSTDPQCVQNPRILLIYVESPQSVRFLRLNPSIRKPIHPPPYVSPSKRHSWRESW